MDSSALVILFFCDYFINSTPSSQVSEQSLDQSITTQELTEYAEKMV